MQWSGRMACSARELEPNKDCIRDGSRSCTTGSSSLPDGQNEMEQRSAFAVRRRGNLTAMTLDDTLADGETQSGSVSLRRNERVENPGQILLADSWSGVLHRHPNSVDAGQFRADTQLPASINDRVHRFHRVDEQVGDKLLQLTSMTSKTGNFGRQLDAGHHASIPELGFHRPQHAKNYLVHIAQLSSLIVLLEQGSNAIQHLVGTTAGIGYLCE